MTSARSQSALWCAALLCCFVALAVVVAPWGPSPASGGDKSAAAKAAEPRFLFSGIEWGTRGEDAFARLESNGYRRDRKGVDAKRIFCTGTLFDRAVTATGDLDDSGGVARWTVLVLPVADRHRYPAMRRVYDQIVAELTERHGQPRRFFDKFAFPFERGDDREDQALAEGRATSAPSGSRVPATT